MQEYYVARAREYDKVYLKPERQSDLRAIEEWLPPIFEGASILEVACGTGYWTQFLAPVALRILAVDAVQETMKLAFQKARSNFSWATHMRSHEQSRNSTLDLRASGIRTFQGVECASS